MTRRRFTFVATVLAIIGIAYAVLGCSIGSDGRRSTWAHSIAGWHNRSFPVRGAASGYIHHQNHRSFRQLTAS